MSKTRKAREKHQPAAISNIDTLKKLLEYLNIRDWDLLIIGDGSGCGWNMGAGWAWSLLDRQSKARAAACGALDKGTVTIGELFPCWMALNWYVSEDGPGRDRQKEMIKTGKRIQTIICSDSTGVVNAGNYPPARKSYPDIWSAIEYYQQHGFNLLFKHIPRDMVNMHILLDQYARRARINLKTSYQQTIADLQTAHPSLQEDLTIYDLNP